MFVLLCSCEQNSSQTKSDQFPNSSKKFKRSQNGASDRESATTRKNETQPAKKQENSQVRKQTKSSSSIKEPSEKQLAAAQDGESESALEQHSDVPVCTGKQQS